MTDDRDTTLLERELRATLHGLADAHDPAALPRDLWARGRAQQPTKLRLDLVAAAVVLIALLASAVLVARPGIVMQPASVPDGGALPTDVWLPELDDVRDRRSTLDNIGPASIATMLDAETALLVSAEDGEHHVVELDGAQGGELRPAFLALSPDGRHLAHAYRDESDGRDRTTTGIMISSLVDGGAVMRALSNPAGDPIVIDSLQWSPDGSWLTWSGRAMEPNQGWIAEAPWVGVMKAEAGRPRQWQLPSDARRSPVVAAADTGAVAVATYTRLWQLDTAAPRGQLSRQDSLRLPESAYPMGALNSSGTILSIPMDTDADSLASEGITLTSQDLDLTGDELSLSTREWIVSEQMMQRSMSMLGRTPDDALIALDNGLLPRVERSVDGQPSSVLTRIHREGGDGPDLQFTVAFGLGDAEPVTFGKPSWAANRLPWIIAGLAAPVLLLAILWGIRRRCRAAAPSTSADVDAPPGQKQSRRVTKRWQGWAIAVAISAAILAVPFMVVAIRQYAGLGAVPGWLLAVVVISVLVVLTGIRRRSTGRAPFRGYGRALVLLLALLYASQPIWPTLALTPGGGPALPRTVFVPDFNEDRWEGSGNPIAALNLDRASVVLRGHSTDIVVVDAADGSHHLVNLPGHHTFMDESPAPPLALSPDGRRLAWAYADFRTDEAGIAMIDLGEEEITHLPLTGRQGYPVRVDQMSFSPDGSHLAWYGDEASNWRDANSSFLGEIRTYGVTASDQLTATYRSGIEEAATDGVLAVDNEGRTHVLIGTKLLSFTAEDQQQKPRSRVVSHRHLAWSSAAITADGRTLAVGVNGVLVDGLSTGVRTLDLTDPDSQLTLHPWHAARDGDRVDVLGFSPSGSPAVVHTSDLASSTPRIVLLNGDESRSISTVSDGWADGPVTIATDLVEQSPLDVHAPRWPVSMLRWGVIAMVAAMLAIELASLFVIHRRRRNQARASRV